MTHSLAVELNDAIRKANPSVFEMLSSLGRELYFPKGILTQTAEAKQKAKTFNATIGIAREKGRAMHLPCLMERLSGLTPDEALTYAPSPGFLDLRREWKDRMLHKNPSLRGKEIGLPLVTCGITQGLSLTADMFVDAGDAVLIPDMVWGNYNMIFGVRRGARMVKYPFFAGDGFDSAGFARTVRETAGKGKVVVLLNFPNNPTGYTVTEKEAGQIADALIGIAREGRRVVALVDDAYFGLRFDESAAQESLFVRLAGADPNLLAVKLDGATKEDYAWGLRVGFATFGAVGGAALYEALEKKAGGCVRGSVSNNSQAAQNLLLKAMKDPRYEGEKRDKFAVMKARFQKAREVLSNPKFGDVWKPYPFNSGYFLCVRLNGLNAEEYRLRLLDRYGIGVIATSPTDIRVAFSCLEVNEIEACFEGMRECAASLKDDARARDMGLHGEAFEE